MKAQNIYLVSSRGGTGKSLIAAHLGVTLQQKDNKVLLVEGNPLFPTHSHYFRIRENRHYQPPKKGQSQLKQLIQRGLSGVDVMVNIHEIPRARLDLHQFTLSLEGLKKEVLREYDYILWDVPETMLFSKAMKVDKKDKLLYVGLPDELEKLEEFLPLYRSLKLNTPLYLVINRLQDSEEVIKYHQHFDSEKDLFYLGYVFNDSQGISEAQVKKMPLSYNENPSPIMDCMDMIATQF